MIPYLVAFFALVLSFLFLTEPFVIACGGRAARWKLYLFHLALTVATFLLTKKLL